MEKLRQAYIWRMEDENGIGCYEAHLPEAEKIYKRHNKDNKNHPLPEDDIGIKRLQHAWEICGFISLEQALFWFNKNEIKFFKKFGFEIKKIPVCTIPAIGKKQCLATRTEKDYQLGFQHY